jgi:O-methyltransferase involved in polyketide biosynthesis
MPEVIEQLYRLNEQSATFYEIDLSNVIAARQTIFQRI